MCEAEQSGALMIKNKEQSFPVHTCIFRIKSWEKVFSIFRIWISFFNIYDHTSSINRFIFNNFWSVQIIRIINESIKVFFLG